MSYDYESWPPGLSGEDGEIGLDRTLDYDAYYGPGSAAPMYERSQDSGWVPSAGGSSCSGFSGYMNDGCYIGPDPQPTAQPWLGQVITTEPLQDHGFWGVHPENTAFDIGNIMYAAGRLSDPPMDLPPRHEHVQAVSPDKFQSFSQSPPLHSSSVRTPSYDVPPIPPPPSRQQHAHGNPYIPGRKLPQSEDPLNENTPEQSMSASVFHEFNNSQWVVRQRLYRGNSGGSIPTANTEFPVMLVNVSAKDALDPITLANVLPKPLDPAFRKNQDRKGKKWTCRYAFVDSPPNNASQHHEYAAGDQHSQTVSVARSLFGDSSRSSAISVPLKRATVVEKVAHGLYTFMGTLKAQNRPLKFNGLDVDYNHLRIVNIFRPTVASMQPTLEILDEFRHLYTRTACASYATP
ncbi:uncharacterized protein TRAVEDRAFT_49129 [Trametes versicolor FP-101664 SS1]|uniref:uncharacterized protein n=1 Tax=Trametes versicolor (strain FP-101664) TaxID=717944 RepID=UPI00046246D1|nr:uncharacterized protein TRAVEDRAFT_49129 [Trametes versicolor FP-101664 SS1]EIW56293.1 hypothetical protein TRAVEDRAFT_49129 [Trametes versicolor FP-101664 SS1]